MIEWQPFPEVSPKECGTYAVCVATKNGTHVETAEVSLSRNAFIWYSRRGYPYEIEEVTHWKDLRPLPQIGENHV